MIEFVPFQPGHIHVVAALPGNEPLKEIIESDPVYGQSLADAGPAWTGVRNGVIVGCAGFKREWIGRATAWMVVVPDLSRREWVEIRAKARREIEALGANGGIWRVEANVLACYEMAHNFATSIGFELEAYNEAFDPRGRDSAHYKIINREALPWQ